MICTSKKIVSGAYCTNPNLKGSCSWTLTSIRGLVPHMRSPFGITHVSIRKHDSESLLDSLIRSWYVTCTYTPTNGIHNLMAYHYAGIQEKENRSQTICKWRVSSFDSNNSSILHQSEYLMTRRAGRIGEHPGSIEPV